MLPQVATTLLALLNEIVTCSEVGELVALHLALALVDVNLVVAFQDLKDVVVHADFVAANDCASLLVSLDLVVPRVVADVLDSEALRRVRVQDETYQVLGLLREE